MSLDPLLPRYLFFIRFVPLSLCPLVPCLYFTDMNNDVTISETHVHEKSTEGYSKLPNLFTKNDVMRCFGLKTPDAIKKKIYRLTKSGYIAQIDEGENKGCYTKLKQILQ